MNEIDTLPVGERLSYVRAVALEQNQDLTYDLRRHQLVRPYSRVAIRDRQPIFGEPAVALNGETRKSTVNVG